MTTPADVLKMIKEKEVKFVDLRFTDTRGKEQHVTVPTSSSRWKVRRRQDVRGRRSPDGRASRSPTCC